MTDAVVEVQAFPVVSVIGVRGIPEVVAGADLAALVHAGIAGGGLAIEPGDIVVVTSKIVSKAHGRYADSTDRRAVVAAETVRVVAERMTSTGATRIVEGRCGVVSAAAGVDASNTGAGEAILVLPERPDEAAEQLRAGLALLAGHDAFGVIVTDTAGRPWRGGQTDFALGAAGVRVIEDYRGLPDADGRQLDVTAIAVADELAAAADLVKGKVERIPVALVRGLGRLVAPDSSVPREGAARLVRRGPGDFFAMGHIEAARAALGAAPGSAESVAVGIRSVGAEPGSERLARAVRLAALTLTDTPSVLEASGDTEPEARVVLHVPGDDVDLGRLIARLEVALWSEGLTAHAERAGRVLTLRANGSGG